MKELLIGYFIKCPLSQSDRRWIIKSNEAKCEYQYVPLLNITRKEVKFSTTFEIV
jgi:hypothetical protein